jgi:hypothetical protein
VTPTTISNCFKKAGFGEHLVWEEDDLPLAFIKKMRIMLLIIMMEILESNMKHGCSSIVRNSKFTQFFVCSYVFYTEICYVFMYVLICIRKNIYIAYTFMKKKFSVYRSLHNSKFSSGKWEFKLWKLDCIFIIF